MGWLESLYIDGREGMEWGGTLIPRAMNYFSHTYPPISWFSNFHLISVFTTWYLFIQHIGVSIFLHNKLSIHPLAQIIVAIAASAER